MALTPSDIHVLGKALYAFAGSSLDARRADVLESRLQQIAIIRGLTGIEPLVQELREPESALAAELIESLVNSETQFFRDQRFFDALREHVFPAVIETRRPLKRLRVLSAGCSTGQEVYSVAMLLRESFPELARWHVELTGVDVSTKRIERSKAGLYTARELERGVPPDLAAKYFRVENNEFRVVSALRALTRFYPRNLAQRWSGLFGFDVVLLRNVLIYLDDEVKTAVLQQARGALQASGMLLLGAAETLDSSKHPFQRTAWSSYQVYLPR